MKRRLIQLVRFIILNIFISILLVIGMIISQNNYHLLTFFLIVLVIGMVTSLTTNAFKQLNFNYVEFQTKPKQLNHYQVAGLNDRDTIFFRKEMAITLERIENIIKHMNTTNASQMMFERLHTKKILKVYFQKIVKYPAELSEATDFLYRILPHFEDKIIQYHELNSQADKTSNDFKHLQYFRKELENLATETSESYHDFVNHTNTLPHLELQPKFKQDSTDNQSEVKVDSKEELQDDKRKK